MLEQNFDGRLVDGTLVVRGTVDDYGIIALRNLLEEHGGDKTGRLVVDLSEVDYLPSVAVGVLTRALGAMTRAGGELDLVARRGSVAQRVLMICALPYRESADDDFDPPDAGITA